MKKKPRIGAHKSIAISLDLAIDRAIQSTCECLQIFTRPPRRWEAGKDGLKAEIIEQFLEKSKKANFVDTAIHMPYLPNLASPDELLFQRSIRVLSEEIEKSAILHAPFVITHLGSPKERNSDYAINRVIEGLNIAQKKLKAPTMVLLENSTARRKKWGTSFSHIEAIIAKVDQPENIGVCLDTAHAFSAGYDIRTVEGLHSIIDFIDDHIGKNKLKLIHLNDSKGKLGSGIDHHDHIGKGNIGIDCFRELMQHQRFKKIPMILETPKENDESDFKNLELLRTLRSND